MNEATRRRLEGQTPRERLDAAVDALGADTLRELLDLDDPRKGIAGLRRPGAWWDVFSDALDELAAESKRAAWDALYDALDHAGAALDATRAEIVRAADEACTATENLYLLARYELGDVEGAPAKMRRNLDHAGAALDAVREYLGDENETSNRSRASGASPADGP